MKILRVNAFDLGGGAERIARTLLNSERQAGHLSRLVVSEKRSNDPDVLELLAPPQPGRLGAALLGLARRLRPPANPQGGKGRLHYTNLRRGLKRLLGIEIFDFPNTYRLFELAGFQPDILHLQNLHRHDGGFFDLRALPWLSHTVPTAFTLHDTWLLSGHCAYSMACPRWETGCGHCPDLNIYPPVRRDATAYNWRAKRAIYRESRLYIATPSRWLLDCAERSMLKPAMRQGRVIHDGIDLELFRPGDQQAARAALGLPQELPVVFSAAAGLRGNPFKDYATLRRAWELVAARYPDRPPLFVGLGEDSPPEALGTAQLRFLPFQPDPRRVALCYQAADVYVHAARADTFPNTVLEALACGLPVAATAVGGVPEQIVEGQTGWLSPVGDAAALAGGIIRLLDDTAMRSAFGQAAAEDARRRFDQRRMCADYLAWFEEIRTLHS